MLFRHGALSRRDAFLLLIGASSMHIWSLLFSHPALSSDVAAAHQYPEHVPAAAAVTTTVREVRTKTSVHTQTATQTATETTTALVTPTPKAQALAPHAPLPPTEVLAHAPGWTLFRNLYMSNGTFYLVAKDSAAGRAYPEIRMMTSTGLEAFNTPENIAEREPTEREMRVVGMEEAQRRWVDKAGMNRVWSVEGNTLLFNDPKQFLRHYYHLVAELFFGVQAFWHGAFSQPTPASDTQSHFSLTHPAPPPIHRAIFIHSNADGWRDSPGFNRYFLRGAFPSLAIEHEEDWADRVLATTAEPAERAFHFPLALLTDRSAAHRGPVCGSQTQRTAAEAWEYMRGKGKLRGLHTGGWWAPVREAMWRFAGAEEGLKALKKGGRAGAKERKADQVPMGPDLPPAPVGWAAAAADEPEVVGISAKTSEKDLVDVSTASQAHLPAPSNIVITYISRQSAHNRKLIKEDHDILVASLKELVEKKNGERKKVLEALDGMDEDDLRKRAETTIPPPWEFHELLAERMTKDEQVRAAARTTIMLGVHGNGLTSLVFMAPTRVSTVIELFYPRGFAHDYQWTTRALGMAHFAVWNDTHHTHPNKPRVDYPDGFQGNAIPVHGPTVAQLIEDRVAGKL